ncbi:MAG: hypothetical protein OES46_14210 [Gammaproteobacteria bacterium]|nr:hypothetical protein [Gammaproteobacteria bacterium]
MEQVVTLTNREYRAAHDLFDTGRTLGLVRDMTCDVLFGNNSSEVTICGRDQDAGNAPIAHSLHYFAASGTDRHQRRRPIHVVPYNLAKGGGTGDAWSFTRYGVRVSHLHGWLRSRHQTALNLRALNDGIF